MLQPLPSLCKSFLAMQRGSRVPQCCCIPPPPPPQTRAFGDHRGERRCPDGGMEERRLHVTRQAMGTGTSAGPRQLERGHADIAVWYKRKG